MAQKKLCTIPQKTINQVLKEYPTPFYVYDEKGIRETAQALNKNFSWTNFKEYFAVKATPTPAIMKLLYEEGCGMDCSSLTELMLCEQLGIRAENIMFSANNTPLEEYEKALELGAIINLDDITHIQYLEEHCGSLPETICFRYNPGDLDFGNNIIGKPADAKFGLTKKQMIQAYGLAKEKGCKRFGIHTMLVSNELGAANFSLTADIVFSLAKEIEETHNIKISFINLGGGLGIPYEPRQENINLVQVSAYVKQKYEQYFGKEGPQLMMENGRYMTGPYAYLITKVRHIKDTHKQYLGVDASMCDLMRPGMYDAYHHITVLGKDEEEQTHTYDVVGSLCENNDKFAIDRKLPETNIGDVLLIHDVGAHAHTMGFNYNGKLRCAELLLTKEGSVKLIRRAQTPKDYFSTLDF